MQLLIWKEFSACVNILFKTYGSDAAAMLVFLSKCSEMNQCLDGFVNNVRAMTGSQQKVVCYSRTSSFEKVLSLYKDSGRSYTF